MALRLFLSRVSDEFGGYRDLLRRALTRPNVEVKIQEDFKPLGGDTLRMLRTRDRWHGRGRLLGDNGGNRRFARAKAWRRQ